MVKLTSTPDKSAVPWLHRKRGDRRAVFVGLLMLVAQVLCIQSASAQYLNPGDYFWYRPEHEQQGRTAFYTQPTFSSGTVRVTRAQRFKLLGVRRGWSFIEFDYAGKAYVHLRVMRNAMHDPTASDPWHEFQRASIFSEDPTKIEARLKGPSAPASQTTDSKTPSWKRYKDGWNLKPSRPTQVPTEGGESTASAPPEPSRPQLEKKPRSKHSLLPPIGSEPPPKEASESNPTPSDGAHRPSP